MKRTSGTFVACTTLGETVRAFVPAPLPPAAPPMLPECYRQLNEVAERALGRLCAVAGIVPSVEWLLYSAIRKEALLTSRLEGTNATLADLFDQEADIEVANSEDVEEITNHLRAFHMMRDNLRSSHGLPISTCLIREAHRMFLDGARGASKYPGELRRTQNWIGGSRPGTAVFVPPPPDQVPRLLTELERFIHTPDPELPPLVRLALIHAQFETMHPFLDGNGRIGRLLIGTLLEEWQLLPEPLLYLSWYLKRHQATYYRLLSATRDEGDWEAWVSFFLEGVAEAAAEAERSVIELSSLIADDRRGLYEFPGASAHAFRLLEALPMMPRFTIERARRHLGTSFPTASAAVGLLVELGMVVETTGQAKHRVFSYQRYIELLARAEV